MKTIVIFIFLVAGWLPVFAQQEALEQALQQTTDKNRRLPLLNKLAEHYSRKNPDKAILYATDALKLAQELNSKKINDSTTGEAEYTPLLMLRTLYHSKGNFEKAIIYEIKLAHYYKAKNDYAKLSAALSYIADGYTHLGVLDTALEYYLQLLQLEEEKKHPHKIAAALNSVGLLFRQQGNFGKAFDYFFEALKYNKQDGHEMEKESKTGTDLYTEHLKATADIYNNIGGAHYLPSKPHLDSALYYFQKAFELRSEAKDSVGMSKSLNNLGLIYRNKGDYKNAIANFEKCLSVLKSRNDTISITTVLDNIGDLYLQKGDTEKALYHQSLALNIAMKHKLKARILECYESLVNTYVKMGNYQKAHEFERKLRLAKDSLYTDQSAKLIAEMQTRFETDKHQKNLELLTTQHDIQSLELEKKNQLGYLLAFAFVSSVAAVFFMYRQFSLKKKSNIMLQEQNMIIQRHRLETEEQRDKLELALGEIDKKNNDIMSSINYAKRMQQAILPRIEEITKELPECFVLFRPKSRVSGDFYWFAQKDEKILIAAVDCTGHGVPGAFMSLIGTNLLNEIVHIFNITAPEQILCELDKGVRTVLKQQSTHSRDGMDLALCVINRETGMLEFAGAKNPLVFIADGQLHLLKGDRYPIGGEDFENHQKVFTSQTIDLKKYNSTVQFYLFSDGFQDQFGGFEDKKFMIKRLKELFLSIHQKPVDEQKRILDDTLTAWMGNHRVQTDDVLVMGFQYAHTTHQQTENNQNYALETISRKA